MHTVYEIAMDICRVRDALEPIAKGEIRKGHASNGDLILEPSMRKTMLKDARSIANYQQAKLNESANALIEHHKLFVDMVEMLQTWVKVVRRGDMGDYSPVIFDTEHLLERIGCKEGSQVA